MTVPLTFNAPTVASKVEVSFGRLPVQFNAPAVAGGSNDPIPPSVTLVAPTSLQLEPDTAVVLDVIDNVELRRVLIAAAFEGLGVEELVHNGDRFAAAYAARSTRLAISGGWRYSLRRNGGWPVSPSLQVYATDTSGLEA